MNEVGRSEPPREYILYADESVEKGTHFSNFYGGLMVSSRDRDAVVSLLEAEKVRLNLHGEVKWQKVTLNYLDKYRDLTSLLFELVRDDKLRLRILFTDNSNFPASLAHQKFTQRYLRLYLFLIEKVFDFEFRQPNDAPARLRLMLDELPISNDDKRIFRQQLYKLNSGPAFRGGNVLVFPDAIGEIDSRIHVLLQCLDIVLGAMQFRMNARDADAACPKGNRPAAKLRLSSHILSLVRSIHPDFRMEISTPVAPGQGWLGNYRHHLYDAEE